MKINQKAAIQKVGKRLLIDPTKIEKWGRIERELAPSNDDRKPEEAPADPGIDT
jgi:hypothetical protein